MSFVEKVKLLGPPDDLPPKEAEIKVEEAEAAAQEAGLSVIRVKRLKASAKIGQFLEQIGAQRVGRTVLLLAQEHLETGIQQCDDLIAKADPKEVGPELIIEVVKLKQAFTDQLIKAGVAQMKTEERAAAATQQNKTLTMPFPPGSQIAIKTEG